MKKASIAVATFGCMVIFCAMTDYAFSLAHMMPSIVITAIIMVSAACSAGIISMMFWVLAVDFIDEDSIDRNFPEIGE